MVAGRDDGVAVVHASVVEVMPAMYVGRYRVAADGQAFETVMEGDAEGYARGGDGD